MASPCGCAGSRGVPLEPAYSRGTDRSPHLRACSGGAFRARSGRARFFVRAGPGVHNRVVGSWTRAADTVVHRVGLDSIKTRVLVFAVLATLLPSLALGWRSYALNQQFVTERLDETLRSMTTQTAREIDLWLKERLYEMRVFAASYEVTENLEKLAGRGGPAATVEAHRRLTQFLRSVRERFADYEELLVVGPSGSVLLSSAEQPGTLQLPPDWLKLARADTPILGESFWDQGRRKGVLAIAVPINSANGTLLGVLAGALNFGTLERMLASMGQEPDGHIYVLGPEGTVVFGSRPAVAARMTTRVPAAPDLFARPDTPLEYADYRGEPVVGRLKPVTQLRWGVVAEVKRQAAYAAITRMRNLTLGVIAAVLLGIGLAAYLLALTIVRPLNRLTAAATKVAADDLDVSLPVVSPGELGYLTAVFNRMVSRLRQGREELHQLSITDGLTGLPNRKHLMETLAAEVERARELRHPVSVLMIDVDHFKRHNDDEGHLGGDALLVRVSALFKNAIRKTDYAARYGGDEFLVLLRDIGQDEAATFAERLRTDVAGARALGGPNPVTVSIGVASYPAHGESAEAVIASADTALYRAKENGRNRVALAGGRPVPRATGDQRAYRGPTSR